MTDRAARQPHLDRNRTIFRAEQDVDALFRPLAAAVRDSVKCHTLRHNATPQMTPLSYAQIMRDVDAALVGVRGRFPGDREAPLYRLVVRRCQEARALAFRRAVEEVRRRLRREPALLSAIEQETV